MGVFLDNSGVGDVLHWKSEHLLQVLNLNLLVGGLAVGDLVNFGAANENLNLLRVLGIKDLFLHRWELNHELVCRLVQLDVGGTHQTILFLVVGRAHDPGGVQTHVLGVEHETRDNHRLVLTWRQGVHHDGSLGEEFHDDDFGSIFSEADTDMSRVGVRKLLHFVLHLEQQTVSIHELRHFGHVAAVVIFVGVCVTDNGLLLLNNFELLANLVKNSLIWVVVVVVLQEQVGVLVGGPIGDWVDVDLGTAETRSKVIDGLHDLSAHLSHLI